MLESKSKQKKGKTIQKLITKETWDKFVLKIYFKQQLQVIVICREKNICNSFALCKLNQK